MRDLVKKCFDIIASSVGILILSPVCLIIILLIKLMMPGPVFFCQVSRYGEPFKIFKFRTMTTDHGGNSISVKGESRITSLGAFLRKYKLDELPELWNVLKGDMSFVGPRPNMMDYADRLTCEERHILEYVWYN